MSEVEGARPSGSPALRRNDAALSSPRGAGATLLESLRRRCVQAELQLREMEDRFRRDCARQEQELELLRIENNKYKTKIEEMRMMQTAPREVLQGALAHGGESKLLKASSRKYCMAREAVERSRDELNEIRARVLATRQRIHETRRKVIGARSRASLSSKLPRRSCAEIELQTRASRSQLRGLEAHVEFETDRRSGFIDAVKELRTEIDVLQTAQRNTGELFRDREHDMLEVMKESSFLIEVCNVLCEERDACQRQLVELQRAFEADNEAYERTFHDLLSVEERDKTVKAKLRESIAKLQGEMQQVVTEREAAERLLGEDDTAFRRATMMNVSHDNDGDGDNTGVSLHLAEFERYISRLADIADSENLSDIESYVCEGGEGRFKLYSVLHRTQDTVAALKQERDALQEARRRATGGPESEQRAREELEELQAQLLQVQSETLEQEQQAECVRSQLDAVLPDVQSIFQALGCDDSLIVAQHGVAALSRGTLNLFLAAIEQRLEEYVAVWRRRQQPLEAQSSMAGYDAPGPTFKLPADASTSTAATPPRPFLSTHEPETSGHDKSLKADPPPGGAARARVQERVLNGVEDANSSQGSREARRSA
ncbi:axonemal p66.0 [Trypanosoma conorhini]|uniref:Axonemal p66.0 n=1 Tax=Trypanosoma conorhini TaxID=83891 RepID=A0A3R7LGA3_9TRYP|nr:axonemal p66.0 [Trypanosoma conorhini]RNF26739.1 axonemal p66.0 [Trypanosoma conorhini]